MGEVGIPALGRGEGPLRADAALGHSPGPAAQTTTDAEQAGVAQADAAADHVKAHKAGARGRAVEVGLVGMEPQAQGGEVCKEHLPGTTQGLRMIGKQGQIIHVAKTGPDARKGPQLVIEVVEVEIGQKLAGEVADRQAAGSLQWGEQGVAGEGIDGGAAAGAVGEDRAQQPKGAGAGVCGSSWASRNW